MCCSCRIGWRGILLLLLLLLGVGRCKVAISEFIQVHSYGNQVSAAVGSTKWAMMSDASMI